MTVQKKSPQTVKDAGDDIQSGHEKSGDKSVDDALDQVQAVVDEETSKGYRGTEVDQTPNEAYTVQGDASSTPEAQANPTQARIEASNPASAPGH